MADTQRASQIPVMSPRVSHSGSSSLGGLPSPHLGLVPPSRYPSVSGSPSLVSPPTSPSPPSSGGVSTPFRTFRNFLSFGSSNKHAPSPAVPSAIPKNHFGSLGPVRRSVNVERRASSPQLARRSQDDYVLSIDLPRPGDEKPPNTRSSKSSNASPVSQSPLSSSQSSAADSAASPAGTPALLASELSTILEAETSGISKHLPSLDTSQAESERASDISPNAFQPQALYPPPRNTRHGSSSPSNDTSALDLSTSKLTSEVLAALSETGGQQDWLNGVVVDDVPSDTAISRERTPESPDTSFNLNSLDPDLAALLSPNRVYGSSTEPAVLLAIDAMPPPASSSPPSPTKPTFSPRAKTAELQASTSTRRIPTSLSVASRLPSHSSTIPRITRSVSDRPIFSPTGKSGPPSPITCTPSGRAMSSSPERPSSMSSASALSRLSRASPGDITATANSSIRRPGSSGNREERRTPASRLMTPARPSSSSASTSTSRPPMSRLHSTPNSVWEADSASPSSRAPSSIGTAPSRLQNHRPSLDIERPRLTGSVRTRKRSTSVIENRVTSTSPSHPPVSLPAPRNMADWLGPRTAKAFAAAGLLDFDKDSSPASASRPPSRFGPSRSSIDRDSRSRYTPSRMAYSEAGSSSSYGARSGSISRAAGYSESPSTTGPMSETMSPRTVFSSASTAPTSVSASSLNSEVQLLQEKHALETSALLSALADSQRTTRMLRDENGQLRERIQMLEDKLADAQERIQAILYSQPPAVPPNPMYPSKRYGSPASSSDRRLPAHSRTSSFVRRSSPGPAFVSPETPYDAASAFVPSYRKRASVESSVFATLPSNMSMIMQEEGAPPDTFTAFSQNSSSPPGSPTMVLARVNAGHSPSGYPSIPKGPSSRSGYSHAANKSVSSAGNISPTTANFSIMTGSPGSLNLRPEHERHLGDMPPLDLDAEGFEFDDSSLR
ncbi:hypothetical protein DICSQDRAFT_182271 [Dichomitus squalens LYAD-421 SS1]|uniref:Uncharacterized protein n=1 Tax=Dichomitus squalens (strain LYAD-421) TaxID=732165 RepID=R7SSH8_DICSQ|nr:uncharacterized protein DICSQDRAFT_182271 [Dichomitus squalens LYAD-421 SS1]EJF58903.1 hypothetical protein DICSQDRAFT_182271 [Dichomitus squalens LYAD-421 SS1]